MNSAQVQQEMASFLQCQRLKDMEPLTIPTLAEEKKGSFREPWRTDNCSVSVRNSNMYEAGGSLYWLDPIVSMGGWADDAPMLEEPSWYDVCEAESVLVPDVSVKERLYFPDPFLAFTKITPDGVSYPSNLRIMKGLTGVYGWYVAACRALQCHKGPRIEALDVMARTISVRLYHYGKTNDHEAHNFYLVKSLQNSEKSKVANVGDSALSLNNCLSCNKSAVLLLSACFAYYCMLCHLAMTEASRCGRQSWPVSPRRPPI